MKFRALIKVAGIVNRGSDLALRHKWMRSARWLDYLGISIEGFALGRI